ncbi:TB2/DP1 proteinHVA22 family protein [Aphelenchoides avenae]|nr:TB2/DP1 proteinHVA22 family protein [Aphelenchus avenae]
MPNAPSTSAPPVSAAPAGRSPSASRPQSPDRTSAKETSSDSDLRTAIEPEVLDVGDDGDGDGDSLNEFHSSLIARLYRPDNVHSNAFWMMLEENLRVRRETIVYAVLFTTVLSVVLRHTTELICAVLGVVYPAIGTQKALQEKSSEELVHWVHYWSIFGFLTMVDVLGQWTAFFSFRIIKAFFLLAVSLPSLGLSTGIYYWVVEPMLKKIRGLLARFLRL